MRQQLSRERALRFCEYFWWTGFVVIAALQMAKVRGGYVTSYGADIVCPAQLFTLTRRGKTLLRFIGLRPEWPALTALGIFGLSAVWEFGQRLGWIPGTFDPLDIAAYAVGIALAWLLVGWGESRPWDIDRAEDFRL